MSGKDEEFGLLVGSTRTEECVKCTLHVRDGEGTRDHMLQKRGFLRERLRPINELKKYPEYCPHGVNVSGDES